MDFQALVDKTCSFVTQPTLYKTLVKFAEQDGMKSRKLVITLARSGMVPSDDSDLTKRLKPLLDHLHSEYTSRNQENRRFGDDEESSLLHQFQDLISDPLARGLLIHLCMIAPVTLEDEMEITYNAFMKELLVAIGGRKTRELNLASILGHGEYDIPIHHSIPANPAGSFYTRNCIDQWKIKLSQTHLTEHLSKKLLPVWASEELITIDRYGVRQPPGYSAFDALRIRIQTGERVAETPMIMKSRWYTNGVVPRVYFVGGTKTSDHSGFMYHVFNSLVDSLPNSHRFGRVDIGRINTFEASELLFYDLTSFTSNMGEQVAFLYDLADYCSDTEVTLFDLVDGPYNVNLGDIIRDYTINTTDNPEFGNTLFPENGPEMQSSAGCLGVVGNIATCNFLHALVQIQLVESVSRAGCAGDDGVLAFTEGFSSERAIECLKALGILVEDKTYRMQHEEDQAVYLKRGVINSGIRGFSLQLSEYLEAPSFLVLLKHNLLSRFREFSLSRSGLVELSISSLSSTFRSASRVTFSSDQKYRAKQMLEWFYDSIGLPEMGYSPPTDNSRYFLPALKTFGLEGFLSETLLLNFQGRARIKITADFDHEPYDVNLDRLERVWLRMSPAVAVMTQLGFLKLVMGGSVGHVTTYAEWKEYVLGGLARTGHQIRKFLEQGPVVWFLYEIDDSYGLMRNLHPSLLELTGYSGDNATDSYLLDLHNLGFDDSGVSMPSEDSSMSLSSSPRNPIRDSFDFEASYDYSTVIEVSGWVV